MIPRTMLAALALASCGGPAPVATPAPVASECDGQGPETPASTLLRVGCDGEIRPGQARWSASAQSVILDVSAHPEGMSATDVVRGWPSLREPPWLGQGVEGVVVLPGERIRVDFRTFDDGRARLFADSRLARTGASGLGDLDLRDRIDAGESGLLTRHEGTIAYARATGREVGVVGYDRLYLVVWRRPLSDAAWLGARVGRDWVVQGESGVRRLPSLSWEGLTSACGAGRAPFGSGSGSGSGSGEWPGAPPAPTVSFPVTDPRAEAIAERLVSAALRGGREASILAGVVGSRGRLAVRSVDPSQDHPVVPSDVAAVIQVQVGDVHPCSILGETLWMAPWEIGLPDGPGSDRVTLIGEVGLFRVLGPRRPS